MNPVTLGFTIACCTFVFCLISRLGGDPQVAFLATATVACWLGASTDLFNDPRD